MIPLARVYRGGLVESFHSGSIAVVGANGNLLAFAGDPNFLTCVHSAAKPFQAIPLLDNGGAEEFDLQPEEIAIICASHGGEPVHVATAAALLRKGDFDEEDLLCGAHAPFDEKAAAELRSSGEAPSPLHNNCSGKHAGMLLATQVMDLPSAGYSSPDHPLQRAIHEAIASYADLQTSDVPFGIDGCGVPAFYLSLYRTAFAFARLMLGEDETSARVVESMTRCPYHVAGAWSITTPLLQAFSGEVVAKEGAEGFYAMGIASSLTERLDVVDDAPVGVAIKIADGSVTRGRNPVILKVLELLGVDVASHRELSPYREWPIRNLAGAVVGEVRAEFELEFL